MFTIHLENDGRSARVGLSAPPAEKTLAPLEQVTSAGKLKRVQALNGQNFLPTANAAQLMEGDPELDLQTAGRLMRDATVVYLNPAGSPPAIATDFKEVEVVYTIDGQEKERRARVFRTANVDTTAPLKIVRRMPVSECLTRFVFRGTALAPRVAGYREPPRDHSFARLPARRTRLSRADRGMPQAQRGAAAHDGDPRGLSAAGCARDAGRHRHHHRASLRPRLS